jgi:flagellar biosynthesis GTPase FlhF
MRTPVTRLIASIATFVPGVAPVQASEHGGDRLLTSKLRSGLGFGISIVTAAAISAFVTSKWGSFAPKDYQECAQRAAKDARSKEALSVLLSICGSEFKGRRKVGGGYTYYDSRLDRTFNIDGPNPNLDEQKFLDEQYWAHVDAQAELEREAEVTAQRAATARARQAAQEAAARTQQAAQEAATRAQQAAQEAAARRLAAQEAATRKLATIRAIQVIPAGFKCWYMVCDDPRHVDMDVKVTNGSQEALSSVTIGLALASIKDGSCPSTYAETHKLDIKLSPGETRQQEMDFLDAAFSKNRLCIRVVDFQGAN